MELPWKLTEGLTARSRRRKFERFMQWARPDASTRLLDIGVINKAERASNFIESLYPWPHRITALSTVFAPRFCRAFPEVAFLRADGRRLPFVDNAFDLCINNAVLEHVGSYENQRRFVAETIRVARRSMIITPDRAFPVDYHTLVPVAHWFPRSIYGPVYRALGKPEWSRENRLNLLGGNRFRALFPTDRPDVRIRFERVRFLGLPAHLIAFVEKSAQL